MDNRTRENLTLGIFVTLGLLIFIMGVYLVGARHSMFSPTTRISAVFQDVSGLQPGNNVEFNGINVGTVEKISIISDTAVRVSMAVEDKAAKFIKKDMKATIGSEGLMGNKVISIRGGHGRLAPIEEGDVLSTIQPLSMDEIMVTVQETGSNALQISRHLTEMFEKLNSGENSLGMLLSDTVLATELQAAAQTLRRTGDNALMASRDFAEIAARTKRGDGTIGKLLSDETVANNMINITDSMRTAAGKANAVMDNLLIFTAKLDNDRSTMGKLLTDTAMADDIQKSILNVKDGTQDLDKTVEKLNDSWLLNGLFHRSSKKDKKKKE